MTMKLLTTLLFAAISNIALAVEDVYDCVVSLPPASVTVTVDNDIDLVTVAFTGWTTGSVTYTGSYLMLAGGEATGGFVATGRIGGSQSSIAGGRYPSEDGKNFFQLYASGNRDIEYGYGNPVSCRLVENID